MVSSKTLIESDQRIIGVVIHDHLERVDGLAVASYSDPSRVGELVEAVAGLRADLESHFTYEEAEMAEPRGLLGLGV